MTVVRVIDVISGSTIVDTQMQAWTMLEAEEWGSAVQQFLLSQPDDYFLRFGDVSVANVQEGGGVLPPANAPDLLPPQVMGYLSCTPIQHPPLLASMEAYLMMLTAGCNCMF